MFSDINRDDSVRDVHYKQCISDTREFSIVILPRVAKEFLSQG